MSSRDTPRTVSSIQLEGPAVLYVIDDNNQGADTGRSINRNSGEGSVPSVQLRMGRHLTIEDDSCTPDYAVNEGSRLKETLHLSANSTIHENIIPEEKYTVEKAIEQLGFGRFQVYLSVLCGLAWVVDSMETMLLSVLSPALLCRWRLTSTQEAFITMTVFVGMLTFSPFWGTISDRYGRKFGLVLSSLVTFYFGILTAASPNYGWILVLRGLTGAGIAGAPQAVTIYSECLPSQYRGRAVICLEVFWAIGTVFAVAIALAVMPSLGWRYLVIFCALPILLFIFLCYWLPESARFYVVTGDKEAATKSLSQIAKWNNKPMPLGELIMEEDQERGGIVDLFKNNYAFTTILLWFLWFAAAFSYYGLVLATTEIFSELSDTDAKCVAKSQNDEDDTCWATCTDLETDDYVDILWTTIAEFPGIIIAATLVELIGRKIAVAVEFVGFALFAYITSACISRGWVTLVLFISRSFVVAAFQTVYVYTCEVYPTTTRAIGIGCGSGLARLGAIFTPLVAQVLLKENIQAAMSIYLAVGLLAAAAALLLPMETRGREMKST